MKKKFLVEIRETVYRYADIEVELDVDPESTASDVEWAAIEIARDTANKQELWGEKTADADYIVDEI